MEGWDCWPWEKKDSCEINAFPITLYNLGPMNPSGGRPALRRWSTIIEKIPVHEVTVGKKQGKVVSDCCDHIRHGNENAVHHMHDDKTGTEGSAMTCLLDVTQRRLWHSNVSASFVSCAMLGSNVFMKHVRSRTTLLCAVTNKDHTCDGGRAL